MIYEQWDIVLVPFPFTNLKAKKKRPALVLSPEKYNKRPDILLMFITSNLSADERPGDYIIYEWKEAGLPKPSMTRMKFTTLDKNFVIKKIAHLTKNDIKGIKKNMSEFFILA